MVDCEEVANALHLSHECDPLPPPQERYKIITTRIIWIAIQPNWGEAEAKMHYGLRKVSGFYTRSPLDRSKLDRKTRSSAHTHTHMCVARSNFPPLG